MNRMNFALALASGSMPRRDDRQATPSPEARARAATSRTTTRATIAKAPTAAQALALALGSPEFQRR